MHKEVFSDKLKVGGVGYSFSSSRLLKRRRWAIEYIIG
jgi:hypothetical protein